MHSLDDLRDAMRAETADLAPHRTLEEITKAGRHRVAARRTGIVAVACAVAVAVAAPLALRPGDGKGGGGEGGGTVATKPDRSAPIRTGVPTDNGAELVVWLASEKNAVAVKAGRRDAATGAVKELPAIDTLSGTTRFYDPAAGSDISGREYVISLPGRDGTTIQVGVLEGQIQQVTAEFNEEPDRAARFARVHEWPDTFVYWVPDLRKGMIGTVQARNAAGKVVDLDNIPVPSDDPRPNDCVGDPATAPPIGDDIRTGAKNSQGKEFVIRFIKNDKGKTKRAGFTVGRADPATGAVPGFECAFAFTLPINPAQYRGTGIEFDGPGFYTTSETTLIDTFAGPVDRITASFAGKPVPVHFARWSAHPELVVYWVTGVFLLPGRIHQDPKVTIYDAAGRVIGTR